MRNYKTPTIPNLLYHLKIYLSVITACALAFLIASCGGNSTDPGPVFDIQTTTTQAHGETLADRDGNVLYVFTRDVSGESKCSGGCIDNWPVFFAEQMNLGNGLNAADFGTISRADGSSQTTFKGWPLYYFAGDNQPGDTNGEGVGEVWYLAKPGYSLMIGSEQLVGKDANNYIIDNSGNYVVGDGITSYFTDIEGRTLYIFINDSANTNNFTNADFSNNGAWPIFHLDIGFLPGAMNSQNFGEIMVHGERPQLTYKGWPIYYFGQDTARGETKGVSVPQPGVWPVARKDMAAAPGYTTNDGSGGDPDPGY